MHPSNLITIFATLLSLIMPTISKKVTNPSRVPKNAVLLSKVSTLTLRNKKLTGARRVDPVPQLECVGPKDVCKLYQVDVMRCVNEGADYDAENIQWSCTASLPDEFKLGSTDVLCEGYESSDDPYVLKGSCGVEYRLLLTDKGEEKYGKISEDSNGPKLGVTVTSAGTIFFIIFLVVLFVILKGIWSSWRQNPPRLGGPRRGTGGGGGGGYNDDNDPPPPYDGPPPYNPPRKPKTQTASNTRTTAGSSRSAPQGNQQQGWRPGFWTGTAAGAAAGYAAGRAGQRREEPRQQQETRQRPAGGGLFSGWTTTQQQRGQQAAPPSSPSFSAPSPSTTRYESTGFGETRRR